MGEFKKESSQVQSMMEMYNAIKKDRAKILKEIKLNEVHIELDDSDDEENDVEQLKKEVEQETEKLSLVS